MSLHISTLAFKIHIPLLTECFIWTLLFCSSSVQSIAEGTYIQMDRSKPSRWGMHIPTSQWSQCHAHLHNFMRIPQNLPSLNTCYHYSRVLPPSYTYLHNHSNVQNAGQIHAEKLISCSFPCSLLPCLSFFSLKACHFIKKSALKRTNVWCTWKPTAFCKQEVDELTNVHKNKTTQGWNKWQSTHSSLHQSDLSILQEMFLLRATTARLVGKVYCQYMLLSYNYSHTIGASGK